jgi:hypothetical protein
MAASSKSSRSKQVRTDQAQRKFYVFVCLITALSFTSVLLMALSPRPLKPDAVSSLFALGATDSLDAIYRTDVPVKPDRWQYVYIRHSRTAGGNAYTIATPTDGLTDHFVICNGDGGVDGELQVGQRWTSQQSAAPVPGIQRMDERCISIVLVGDFDHAEPTDAQLRRLRQLLASLRTKLHISPNAVYAIEGTGSAATIGQHFPIASLKD